MALADMTVLCLVKGRCNSCSSSNDDTTTRLALEGFLSRNTLYNGSRTSLLLVAVATRTIANLLSLPSSSSSDDGDNADDADDGRDNSQSSQSHALWPIQCLLRVAINRRCMPMALMLLNATIPNEMRNRSSPPPPLPSNPPL